MPTHRTIFIAHMLIARGWEGRKKGHPVIIVIGRAIVMSSK